VVGCLRSICARTSGLCAKPLLLILPALYMRLG
jgi:hypothetical protein